LLGLGSTSCAGLSLPLEQRVSLLTEFLFGLARPQAFRTRGLSLMHFLCTSFTVPFVSAALIKLLLNFIREIARSGEGLTVTLDLLHLVIAELISDRMGLVLLRRLLLLLRLLWLLFFRH
jgi:hypothetical protein